MRVTLRRTVGSLAAFTLAFGAAKAADTPHTNLYINGTLASTRVLQNNGIAYVPVADVAKALKQIVVTKPDGYAIASAGGSNQVEGMNGKIGDKITNGQVVFSVVKVLRFDKYERQFSTGTESPAAPGDDLVAIVIRVKNATQKSPWIAVIGGKVTALTDHDEHAYKHVYNDSKSLTPTLLPGSAVDFALVYSIPKSAKLGDLVYQMAVAGFKDTTFRISLASANP